MANSNCTQLANETRSVLECFSNFLYARAGLARSTVDLTVGFIRRMQPAIGLDPTPAQIDAYVAGLRKGDLSYAHVSNAILGWKIKGKTPVESVRTTLIRKSDVFERLDDGKFRLKKRMMTLQEAMQQLQPKPEGSGPKQGGE